MPSSLSNQVRADMFSQLAAMEKAGLPTDQAWGLLNVPTVPAARLQAVRAAVMRGIPPAVAAQKAHLFTPLEGYLVSAAGAVGSPMMAYQRLSESCSQKAKNQGKIRSRMVLPTAILMLALLIQPIPQLVAGTVTASGYLVQVLRPLIAIAALVVLLKWVKASANCSRWLLKVPVYGSAMARGDARNFYESLALLLEAGVPMFEALPTAVATIENPEIRKAYARIKPRMQRGLALSGAIVEEISEPMYLGNAQVIEWISTGEASGTLPEMLFRHADAETEQLKQFWVHVADWVPRIAYAAVVGWMTYALLNQS